MKTKLHSTFGIRHSVFPVLSTAFVAALTLCLAPLAPAQDDGVTISAAEFQRFVYAGHVLTQMDAQPELDASLQVLLELQRRNPHADPAALADVCRQALDRYRANTPAYIRTGGFRDEILAAYLDAFRQVPARTNFNLPTLALINSLVVRLNTPETMQQSDLLNAGFERLLNTEEALPERQSLVDASASRSADHAAFGEAMSPAPLPI